LEITNYNVCVLIITTVTVVGIFDVVVEFKTKEMSQFSALSRNQCAWHSQRYYLSTELL